MRQTSPRANSRRVRAVALLFTVAALVALIAAVPWVARKTVCSKLESLGLFEPRIDRIDIGWSTTTIHGITAGPGDALRIVSVTLRSPLPALARGKLGAIEMRGAMWTVDLPGGGGGAAKLPSPAARLRGPVPFSSVSIESSSLRVRSARGTVGFDIGGTAATDAKGALHPDFTVTVGASRALLTGVVAPDGATRLTAASDTVTANDVRAVVETLAGESLERFEGTFSFKARVDAPAGRDRDPASWSAIGTAEDVSMNIRGVPITAGRVDVEGRSLRDTATPGWTLGLTATPAAAGPVSVACVRADLRREGTVLSYDADLAASDGGRLQMNGSGRPGGPATGGPDSRSGSGRSTADGPVWTADARVEAEIPLTAALLESFGIERAHLSNPSPLAIAGTVTAALSSRGGRLTVEARSRDVNVRCQAESCVITLGRPGEDAGGINMLRPALDVFMEAESDLHTLDLRLQSASSLRFESLEAPTGTSEPDRSTAPRRDSLAGRAPNPGDGFVRLRESRFTLLASGDAPTLRLSPQGASPGPFQVVAAGPVVVSSGENVFTLAPLRLDVVPEEGAFKVNAAASLVDGLVAQTGGTGVTAAGGELSAAFRFGRGAGTVAVEGAWRLAGAGSELAFDSGTVNAGATLTAEGVFRSSGVGGPAVESHLQIRDGRLADTAWGLVLGGISGEIPVVPGASTGPPGWFCVESVSLAGALIPPIEGQVRLDGAALVLDARWAVSGAAAASVHGTFVAADGSGAIHAVLPPHPMDKKDALSRALFLWTGLGVEGMVDAELTAGREPSKQPSFRLRASIADGTIAIPERGMVLNHVGGDLAFTGMAPVTTEGTQRVSIGEAVVRKLVFQDGEAAFRVARNEIAVDAMAWTWGGGRVRAGPFRIVSGAPDLTLDLTLEHVSLQAIFDALAEGRVSGEGELDGRFPLTLTRSGVALGQGFVRAAGPGRVSIHDQGWLDSVLSSNAPSLSSPGAVTDIRTNVVAALRDFDFRELRFDFLQDGEETVVRAFARGKGHAGPQAPEIGGLTVNLRGVNDLLRDTSFLDKTLEHLQRKESR